MDRLTYRFSNGKAAINKTKLNWEDAVAEKLAEYEDVEEKAKKEKEEKEYENFIDSLMIKCNFSDDVELQKMSSEALLEIICTNTYRNKAVNDLLECVKRKNKHIKAEF